VAMPAALFCICYCGDGERFAYVTGATGGTDSRAFIIGNSSATQRDDWAQNNPCGACVCVGGGIRQL